MTVCALPEVVVPVLGEVDDVEDESDDAQPKFTEVGEDGHEII